MGRGFASEQDQMDDYQAKKAARRGMSSIIATSAAVLLFLTVGIGLWDAIQNLHALAAGAAAALFVISAFLNGAAG